MTEIQLFTFNPFQENTYLLYDESLAAVVIDPGCSNASEEREILSFIEDKKLNVERVINTHCHIDHVLGNAFFFDKYDLKPLIHKKDIPVLEALSSYGEAFGIKISPSPEPEEFMEEGDVIHFGNTVLNVKHIPGHAPGHVVLIHEKQKFIIGGDILFYGSIGRTDLPYGDHDTLIRSIQEKLMTMDEDFRVYPGHGPSTTIGFEKKNNPFLQ
jgi:glyoxylase-like metal-dependent hydrolase (beta-lactamase superfamily II)